MLAASHNLIYLILIPLIAGLFYLGKQKKERKFEALFSKTLIQNKYLSLSSQKKHWALILSALGLIILALAEPQYGEKWQHHYQSNIDVVIALDLSTSMLATDIDPNRLQRGKQEIQLLLSKLQGHRVALIGFAKEAFTHVPPTFDHDIISLFLDELDGGLISSSGTRFDDLLIKASYLLRESPKNEKILVIISDGELLGDTLKNSIDLAKKNNITVMTIGVGTEKGSPIPNPENNGIGYLKDTNDQLVISHLNTKTLTTISRETQGEYTHSNSYEMGSNTIYKAIKNKESQVYKNKQKQEQIPRYHSLILIALILLGLDLWQHHKTPKQSEANT